MRAYEAMLTDVNKHETMRQIQQKFPLQFLFFSCLHPDCILITYFVVTFHIAISPAGNITETS